MTRALALITLFLSTLAFGQVTKEIAYNNIEGLTITDSITCKEIGGGFYISDGFNGYRFRLDSNTTFCKIGFSCLARLAVDSGSWTIKNHNTVVLNSSKETLYFDVIKFDKFYFFILPTQRQKFIKDSQVLKTQLKNAKPFVINNKTYTANYLAGYSLVEKYYAKEIGDITGT